MTLQNGFSEGRWDRLANLSMANLLCYYCFYLPHVLYVEGAVSFLAPQFKDFAIVSSLFGVALGLLARPFGALFFGLEADSKSLRKSYRLSTLLLASATLAIAFLPPYSYLGTMSSVIAMALRIAQGFAFGGTLTCAALLAFEIAPEKMQGRYTSFIQASSPAGHLSSLAIVIVAKIFLGEEVFTNWGWRITFILPLLLFYFSKKISYEPTGVVTSLPQKSRQQLWRELRDFLSRDKVYLRTLLLFVLPTFSAICIAIYIGHTYQLYFMQSVLKIEPTRAKFILAICAFLCLPSFVIFGYLADRIGTGKVVITGIILSTLMLIPMYQLTYYFGTSLNADLSALSTNTLGLIFSCWLISTITAIPFGPLISWAAKQFSAPYKATLFACCHGFAFGLLTTIAQLSGTYFSSTGSTPFAAVYFAVGVNILAVLAWMFAKPSLD